jgi:hypothetical protein
MIMSSIESNLEVVQCNDPVRARAAHRNLRDLTSGFDGVADPAEKGAGLGWVLWWAQIRNKAPQAWVHPAYFHALNLPVPGLSTTMEGRKPEERPKPRAEKDKQGKLGLSYKQAGARATIAGFMCGASLWALYYGPAPAIEIPYFLKPGALWSVYAVSGSLALARPRWALSTLPWGLGAGIAFSMLSIGSTLAMFIGWALIGAGFFRARRAPAPLLGAIIGAFVVFVFYVLFGSIAFVGSEYGFVLMGIMAGVFWFAQYFPETK